MPIVQFAPFSSLIQPSFWHELTNIKIDVLKLSDDALPISGSYSVGRSVTDRESGKEIALGCNLSVGSESFDKEFKVAPGSINVTGTFKNYNTIEEFKAADKTALFNKEAEKIWDHIISTRDSSRLNDFLLITFADLKKYKYYYWFAFPAFVSKPAWEIAGDWVTASEEFSGEKLAKIHDQLKSRTTILPYFLVREDGTIAPVEDYSTFFASTPDLSRTVAFLDPSANPSNPGWPSRNLLAYLRALYPESTSTVRVLCWRDGDIPANDAWKSRFGVVELGANATSSNVRPSAVGWEKNPQGKLGPRMADLAPMMDPTR
ncbi:hypothetical protein H0H93_010119 [Arthromyces matolae]|nr:hypothetical protein H0H93_010119 [Arthromyces matolae]